MNDTQNFDLNARLEARWNDARAAYAKLADARAAKKLAVGEVQAKIKAAESARDLTLREAKPETGFTAAFERAHKMHLKAEKLEKELEKTKATHDAEIKSRETAFEAIMAIESAQLPLLLPDLSMCSDIHVGGRLVIVGSRLELAVTGKVAKGIASQANIPLESIGVLTVAGFRSRGEGSKRHEVIVCRVDGATSDLEVKPDQVHFAPDAPAQDEAHGGLALKDRVRDNVLGIIGTVVRLRAGADRASVLIDGTTAPVDCNVANLERVAIDGDAPVPEPTGAGQVAIGATVIAGIHSFGKKGTRGLVCTNPVDDAGKAVVFVRWANDTRQVREYVHTLTVLEGVTPDGAAPKGRKRSGKSAPPRPEKKPKLAFSVGDMVSTPNGHGQIVAIVTDDAGDGNVTLVSAQVKLKVGGDLVDVPAAQLRKRRGSTIKPSE